MPTTFSVGLSVCTRHIKVSVVINVPHSIQAAPRISEMFSVSCHNEMDTSRLLQPGAFVTANSRINNANDEDLGSRISDTLRQVGYTHETARAGAPPLQQLPLQELMPSYEAMEWFQVHEALFKSMLAVLGISHRNMRMRLRVPYNLDESWPLPPGDETIMVDAHPSSNMGLAWIRFVGQAWTYIMNHGRKGVYVEILAVQPTTFEGASRLLELEPIHPLMVRWRKGLDKEIEKVLLETQALADALKNLSLGRIRTGTNVPLKPTHHNRGGRPGVE